MPDTADDHEFPTTLSAPGKRRRWAWPAAIAGSVVAAIVIMIAGTAIFAELRGDDAHTLTGTDLGGTPAPDFTLTNQHGDSVSLTGQRGKITVLTFLYTHCPDVCPLTAAQLSIVQERLGEDARQVAMLAVSVDPERDTVDQAYAFSEKFGLENRWSYLVGSREELKPIWERYFVGVATEREVGVQDSHDNADEHEHEEVLLHTAPVFLIDHEGDLRVIHTTGNDPSSITDNLLHDIELLIDEIPNNERTLSVN